MQRPETDLGLNGPDQLAASVRAGDVRAVARACRMVDEAWPGHRELLAALFPHSKDSWRIGITGSPGVGKSTLTSQLIGALRSSGQRVAVVAVDPSSPFSGGALLGDRIRMQAHWDDPEVFIRSLATRGAMGGLSRTSADIARVLAAWGAAAVLIETVGVGQDELDVMRVADTTLVIQAPGGGDDLQAAKAGLLECADVFAVNKADLPGAESTAQHLRSMLVLGQITASTAAFGSAHQGAHAVAIHAPKAEAGAEEAWEVPVVPCSAARGEGVADVLLALQRHRAWLQRTRRGQERRLQRTRAELDALLASTLASELSSRHKDELDALSLRIEAGEIDPYSASTELVERWLNIPQS
ncbi:MAG TPA: methylmalonyl Co-A mutase-associated GTPase MeaB [Polyangiaceae bacterium]|nr:methylmalonyl Co-A mutase-associated GTPase MeaB [Polyangiaceae bacterium]